MTTKEEILRLIELLSKELKLYEDPVYGKEKSDIKEYERLTFELFLDLKRDGFNTWSVDEEEKKEGMHIAKFSRITVDIPNKLLKIKGFKAEEQWFIVLSVYCWWCETFKNLLDAYAKKIYQHLEGRAWRGFLTLGSFIRIMNRYHPVKYSKLYSDIDVDLRNSFVHGKVDFPNNEIIYYDPQGNEKRMSLEDFLSKFKKLPPLCTYVFSSRLKPFRDEIIEFAKSKGFV